MNLSQPVSGVARIPLESVLLRDMREVAVGVPIKSLAPDLPVVMCRLNGEWVLREVWEDTTRPGDVIEWHCIPQNREDFRLVIAVVSAVISVVAPYTAPYLAAFNVAFNLLVPPIPPKLPIIPGPTEDSYSTSVNGNVARIDQPIWKSCGHVEITPPFASEPYYEYRPKPAPADPNLDLDQYYYAVFAIDIGDPDVIAKISNTPLSRFRDVVRAEYLPPGTLPSSVNTNVTNAIEVSAMVLETGRYVGGFVACASRQTCSFIGVDVVATRGLGITGGPLGVRWQVDYRPIDEFGRALDEWTQLGEESRFGFTSTPQRWSVKYPIPAGVRPEIRVARTDVQDTSPQALHEIALTGLRAYRTGAPQLNPNVAHFELVMRASSQLSSQSSRDVRFICDCYVRTWDPETGWGVPVISRNPMWWALELITSPIWGIGQPDNRIDLLSFWEIAQIADARQDHFDYTFDTKISAWDALQLIARTCRSRIFRRYGVISIARDQAADLPVTAFSPRNTRAGSIKIDETLRQETSPDGFVIQYRDRRTGVWDEINCPVPGLDAEDMSNPLFLRLDGIIGATHAEREGLYEAANLLYRNRTVELTTEMEGLLPAYLSPVKVQPEIAAFGQSGDVAFWTPETKVMGLSEPPNWSKGALYLSLRRDDGTLTIPVLVTPGPTDYEVMLPALPDFVLILNDGTRERPKFYLGPVGSDLMVKVSAIEDAGDDDGIQWNTIRGVVDDPRVHTYDNGLLPGPGDIQDPIFLPDEDAGGAYFPQVYLPKYGNPADFPGVEAAPPNPYSAKYNELAFHTNGVLDQQTVDFRYDPNLPFQHWTYPQSWIIGRPVDPTYADRYEVRATTISITSPVGSEYILTGPTDVWLSMDVDRVWSAGVEPTEDGPASGAVGWRVLFEVRNKLSGIVQDTFDYDFQVSSLGPGYSGGGDGADGDGGDSGDGGGAD